MSKLTALLLIAQMLSIVAFLWWIPQQYGSFQTIPHNDVTMWTFWATFLSLHVWTAILILVTVSYIEDKLKDDKIPESWKKQ